MLDAIIKYNFLQNAILTSVFAAIICGIIGVIVVEKRLLMMTGGVAHTAFGGVGLGYLLGFEPIIGAGIFAVGSAMVIGGVRRKGGVHTDTIISILWSLGMALGIFFTSLMPAYPPDMNSYLFGNILSVTKGDLLIMLPITLFNLLIFIVFYNDWRSYLFDNRFAKLSGIKTTVLEYLLLITVALSIVILIRVVGIILLIALLTVPAATAAFVCKSLKGRMVFSGVMTFAFCFFGIICSYSFDFPSGAATVFAAAVVYFAVLIIKKTSWKNV